MHWAGRMDGRQARGGEAGEGEEEEAEGRRGGRAWWTTFQIETGECSESTCSATHSDALGVSSPSCCARAEMSALVTVGSPATLMMATEAPGGSGCGLGGGLGGATHRAHRIDSVEPICTHSRD